MSFLPGQTGCLTLSPQRSCVLSAPECRCGQQLCSRLPAHVGELCCSPVLLSTCPWPVQEASWHLTAGLATGSGFPLPITCQAIVLLVFILDTQPNSVLTSPTPPGDLLPSEGRGRQAGRMVPTALPAGCVLVYSPAKQKTNGIKS